MALTTVALRTTAGFIVGSVVGKVFKPVTSTIQTAGKVLAVGNEQIQRSAKTRRMVNETNDVIIRMDLETKQRTSLIEYGNQTAELKSKFNEMDEEAQKAMKDWQDQFPETL